MKLRYYALLLLALALIAVIGIVYLQTRPAPVLTVMTWPGATLTVGLRCSKNIEP